QGQAQPGGAGADDEHIVLVEGGHGALCLLRCEVNYMMPVKDLDFGASPQASIYERAPNKELPGCGTLCTSSPLIARTLPVAANLSRDVLSIQAGAGASARQ
ncbi:MAG: hypothetical protein KDI34_20975, partial [Halioglobus sp.]|nr:hypothetical protein [Halioglobus sp.]